MDSKPKQAPVTDLSEMLAVVARHAQSGQLADAEAILKQILHAAPNQPDALGLLSLVQHQSGRTDLAVQTAERALKSRPNAAPIHANLSVMHRKLGNLPKAIEHASKAAALKPDFVDAHYNLGLAQLDAGDLDAALQSYDRALTLKPRFAEAINNRGTVLHKLGRVVEAEAEFRRALAVRPAYPEALNNLGTALRGQGRLTEAIDAYKKALAHRAAYFDAAKNLMSVQVELGRLSEAIAAGEQACKLKPNDRSVLSSLAAIYLEVHSPQQAIAALESLIAAGDATPQNYEVLGLAYARAGDPERAIIAQQKAIALKPDFALAHGRIGAAYSQLGRFGDALLAYDTALRIDPSLDGLYLDIADAKIFRDDQDTHLRAMEAIPLDQVEAGRRMRLHFALGKAYDDIRRYDDAFRHFAAGNALARQVVSYDEPKQLQMLARTIATFTPAMVRTHSGGGAPGKRPIFVVGVPRSGTTLVERIVASHPSCVGAGEIPDFNAALGDALRSAGEGAAYPEFAEGVSAGELTRIGEAYLKSIERHAPAHAAHVVDKLPQNAFYLGLIHLALPNAKIIHVVRDPLDTCLSCFTKLFDLGWPQTYDLTELGHYYRAYRKIMDHWRAALPGSAILEVSYEALIADSEAQSRRILDFCGLDWSNNVRDFHKLDRPVMTASFAQVRRPIYTASIGRWRHYEKHLGPLIAALAEPV